MDNPRRQMFIFILEHQTDWRNFFTEVLRSVGHHVITQEDYLDSSNPISLSKYPPDLVILGCSSIRREEQEFISHILHEHLTLIVLCNSLPKQVIRTLFLAGAYDVTDKPFTPDQLLHLIDQTALGISSQDAYRVMNKGRASYEQAWTYPGSRR